jgi:urocanate hydratase
MKKLWIKGNSRDVRFNQGWLKEKFTDLGLLMTRIKEMREKKSAGSLGYLGNVVELWERLA